MSTVVSATNFSVGYGPETKVIERISFELGAGQIHGLVGTNGTGKTTLLRTIAGQLPYSGDLTVFGHDPFDNLAVMDHTILMGIDSPFPASWSVKKILKIAASRWETWDQHQADELLRTFSIDPDKRYGKLSRGQRSAVGIIVALASGCQLVLLDVPYLGLDVEKRKEFYRLIAAVTSQTIVISTHHLNEVSNLLDTILLIDGPNTVLAGDIDDITETILELIGSVESVQQVLSKLQLDNAVVFREDQAGVLKVIVDLRQHRDLIDEVFQTAPVCGVKAKESTLENAVLAVTGRGK